MDDDDYDAPSYPWSWRAALVMAGDWAANVLDESGRLLTHLTSQIAADHNYRIDQRKMHEQMARELETIMEESE